MVNIGLIEGDRYAAQNVFLMFLLVLFFSLHHAQTTIDFKMCFETINRNVCAIACEIKIVHGCGNTLVISWRTMSLVCLGSCSAILFDQCRVGTSFMTAVVYRDIDYYSVPI